MSAKYKTLLTKFGTAKLAEIQATNSPLNLKYMAVGDGGGQAVQPNSKQTALIGEKYRAQINTLTQDNSNNSYYIAELVVPADVGGWYVREIGLYDDKGNLFAVGNVPETYKPLLSSGSSRDQVFRMIVEIGNSANVVLIIDTAMVLATRAYVDLRDALKIDVDKLIGVPINWPLADVPNWAIGFYGQAISASVYPKLHRIYGARMPDLRGRVIRGWDNGKGLDPGRALLSLQEDDIKSHRHILGKGRETTNGLSGLNGVVPSADMHNAGGQFTSFEGGTETRMKNIAFNYICISG